MFVFVQNVVLSLLDQVPAVWRVTLVGVIFGRCRGRFHSSMSRLNSVLLLLLRHPVYHVVQCGIQVRSIHRRHCSMPARAKIESDERFCAATT